MKALLYILLIALVGYVSPPVGLIMLVIGGIAIMRKTPR